MESVKDDFLSEMNKIKYVGRKIFVCPFVGRSVNTMICYSIVGFLVSFLFLQLAITLFSLNFNDLLEITDAFPNVFTVMMGLERYRMIQSNKELFHDIFVHFEKDFWLLIPLQLDENIAIVEKYLKFITILNKFFIILSVIVVTGIDSLPLVMMFYETNILGKEIRYLHPFDAYYPFDKDKYFFITYLWESILTAIVIGIFAFVNLLTVSIILFFCTELKLLGKCIQNLINAKDVENIIGQRNLKETHEKIKSELRFLIRRHYQLQRYSTQISNALGRIMLFNYCFGGVFICLTAFSCTVVDDSYKAIRYFLFFLSLLLDTFDLCIIGQVLMDHSENLTIDLYSSKWIYADKETKRTLLMFMVITQKPFELSAKGFVTMNLNTFSEISKTSYQLFNLLRTMYGR